MDPSEVDELAYLPNEDILEEYSMTEAVNLFPEGILLIHYVMIEEAFDEEGETDWVCEFFGHNGQSVFSVDCHPVDPLLVVSGGMDDRGFVWRVEPGIAAVSKEFLGHTDSVVVTKFSGDGKQVATASMDGTVRVWRVTSDDDDTSKEDDLICCLEGPSAAITCMEWHPNGPVVIVGSSDGSLWMWNAGSGNCMHVMHGHKDAISQCSFTPDGKHVVSASEEDGLMIWSPKDGKCINKYSKKMIGGGITCFAIHPNSQVIIVGCMDGGMRCVQVHSQGVVKDMQGHKDCVERIQFCDDRQANLLMVASAGLDGQVIIWDAATLNQRMTLMMEEEGVEEKGEGEDEEMEQAVDSITTLKWLPHTLELVSGSVSGALRRWDARSGDCLQIWRGRTGSAVLDIAVSGVAKMVVVAFDDGVAAVYDYE